MSYDAAVAEMFDPAVLDATVDFLAELAARTGRDHPSAFELGIGTGRVALPLSRRGVRVHGVDLSAAMVEQLQRKPGAADIDVTIGDFATVTVGATFDLAYLVFNTIMNLTSQDEQVACFRNAARHLEPGGHFVIEVSVPGLRRLPPGETFQPFTVTPVRVGIDEYDVVNQGLVSHHYRADLGDLQVQSTPFRYVWPAELDLMARLAGMTLVERWGDWNREPFTADSDKHVSVWQRREPAGGRPTPSDQ